MYIVWIYCIVTIDFSNGYHGTNTDEIIKVCYLFASVCDSFQPYLIVWINKSLILFYGNTIVRPC